MVDLNPNISVIILSVNGLYALVKTNIVNWSEKRKKQSKYMLFYKRNI